MSDTAQKAVEKLMIGQLRNLVISETLELHSPGLLDNTPKAVAAQAKKKKGQLQEEFVKSVVPLTKTIDSDVNINKRAKDAIAELMFQMSKALVEKSQTLAEERGELDSDEIIKALHFYMAPNMAMHAIYEGSKNAALFMNDDHYYTEEEFVTKIVDA